MTSLDDALARTLLELVSVPSPIGEERALCDFVEARLRKALTGGGARAAIERFEHSLIVRIDPPEGVAPRARVGLVGHLDTVRSRHDGPPRIEAGRLYGAGSADMKSGLAVMIELVERLTPDPLPLEWVLVFYEREEGPYAENRLGSLLERFPIVRELDLAICVEPSDNKLQLGCMGSLHATVAFIGRTSHSARPWQGDNAIYKSLSFLSALAAREPRDVEVDGLFYREVMSPTLAQGGRARNVVPDRFELNVNYRFAPGRTSDDALSEIAALAGPGAEVSVADLAPAARPHRHHALIAKLIAAGIETIEPKQAWTDVGRFDAIGVAAVNFGPGTQAQAHQPNEYTELAQLGPGYRLLERFLRSI